MIADGTRRLSVTNPNADRPTIMADDIRWKNMRGVHDAVFNGRMCRVVLYPASSTLAGSYGCYIDGRYKGIAKSVDNAKSRCRSLSSLANTARDRVNLRTWQRH